MYMCVCVRHLNSHFQPTLCSASSECLAACRKWLFERSAASWAEVVVIIPMQNDVMSIRLMKLFETAGQLSR